MSKHNTQFIEFLVYKAIMILIYISSILQVHLGSSMPRCYKSKDRYRQYDQSSLDLAVTSVKVGDQTVNSAAGVYGVPRKTISNRLKKGQDVVTKLGGPTIFSASQELDLVKRLKYLEGRGFPLDINGLLRSAYFFALQLSRQRKLNVQIPKNWHRNRKCSRDWWFSFKRRHPTLTLRKAEGISISRAHAFNEGRIESFFSQCHTLYEELEISKFPQLIFNVDETGLSTVPNTRSKVIASRGARTVQSIQMGERGTLSTVIPVISASGDCLPPFVIFKGKAPSTDLLNSVNEHDTGIYLTATKSGYIETSIFIEFLKHFQKHRVKIDGKRCLLFLDGHSAHLSIEATEFCNEHEIELVCLPPHTSHRLQPLDTHFNKSLKSSWSQSIDVFLRSTDETSLSREQFVKQLISIWNQMKEKRGMIVDSFRYCGLYPLDRQAIKDEEFLKSNIFSSQHDQAFERPMPASPTTASNCISEPLENAAAIRHGFPSPNKAVKDTHVKEHFARVSEQLENKKLKVKLKAVKTVTEKKKQPRPSTSRGQVENECCVCNAFFTSTTDEDWLLCPSCNKWSCETCFGATLCYNCE